VDRALCNGPIGEPSTSAFAIRARSDSSLSRKKRKSVFAFESGSVIGARRGQRAPARFGFRFREEEDLIDRMWMVYALAAAIIWGISYAASGRVIERGMTPLVFFFLYTFFGATAAATALVVTGKAGALGSEFRSLEGDWVWLLVAVISSAAGGLLIYMAIGEKNATLASLIEISYPFFVALFAWLFFRDVQFNWQTLVGGVLILAGVSVVFLGERN
jgi:uncharacterized membrane protein